jgi:hypothetical protein
MGRRESRIVVFFRAEGFYPIEIPLGFDTPERLAEHAALNPGTLRIEDTHGTILWSAQKQ